MNGYVSVKKVLPEYKMVGLAAAFVAGAFMGSLVNTLIILIVLFVISRSMLSDNKKSEKNN